METVYGVVKNVENERKIKYMSADNGIYILKTKDQYRVTHTQGIDYIYGSVIKNKFSVNSRTKYNPVRVVEVWADCKYTRDESLALKIAHGWALRLPVCEYGVNLINYNKTWKHILEDAKECVKEEIEYIELHNLEHCYDMVQLHKIADGAYLDEWLHKKCNKGD